MQYETKKRSVLKAISWRTWATITTAVIVFIFTGELALAVTVGFLEVFAKMGLYFFHERLWQKISEKWGSEECYLLLEELVVMEDNKNRQGFDLTVMSELLFLSELLAKEHPEFARPQFGDDIWKVDFSK